MENPDTRGWRIFQDWINTTGSVVAIIGSSLVAAGWALNALPFVRTDIYQNDKAAIIAQVSGLEAMSKSNAAQLSDIKRTGLLSLELNLQSRLELLNGTMMGVPRGSQIYQGLVRERDATQQQLDEVKRELNR